MLTDVRWVLFDAVGTLLYPDPPVALVYGEAGRRFGSRLEPDEIGRRFRAELAVEMGPADSFARSPTSEANELARWSRIVAAVFHELSAADLDDLFQSLWHHFAHPQHWQLYEDVSPAIHRLKESGLRLGIASNFDARLIEIASAKPALASCERVFISSQVGFVKPDPRFFATVSSQLEVSPSQILLVGDDELADVQGARAAGWQALWLDRGAEFQHEHAIASLETLAHS
jgi:putative hydrolase of the HAD superfamily